MPAMDFAPNFLSNNDVDWAINRPLITHNVFQRVMEGSAILGQGFFPVEPIAGTNSTIDNFVGDTDNAVDQNSGESVDSSGLVYDEVEVKVDPWITSAHQIRKDQDLLSMLDPNSDVNRLQGWKIAQKADERHIVSLVASARTASKTKEGYVIHEGGTRVVRGGVASREVAYPLNSTGAYNLMTDIETVCRRLQEKAIDGPITALCDPYLLSVMAQDKTIFDITYSPNNPNSLIDRRVVRANGVNFRFANRRLGSGRYVTNITDNLKPGVQKYNIDLSVGGSAGQPVMLLWAGAPETGVSPIKTLMAVPLFVDRQVNTNKITTEVYSRMLMGVGVFHPQNAAELAVSTGATV